MSTKYPYLDIAISVLNEGNQPVNYSFNSAPTIALPSLSELAKHFVNLSDGYVMWQVGGRRAFTFFQLNDAGDTTVLAVTVRLDPDVLMAGRPIVNLLGTIRRTITDGTKLTHDSIIRAIADSGFPEEPYRSDAANDISAAATGLCCRTYISSTELATIMAYPRQKDYEPYQGVVVVQATVSMQPESSIPLLTTPIDKALMVVCPEDVTASAGRVELSDHLTVTYTMAGFDPQTVDFEVGTTNRYVRINGPALIVNSARHAGITFRRDVPYSVMSAAGTTIDTYTILINGRTATRGDGSFEVSNTDFTDGKVTIAVSSTNFGSFSQEYTPEQLSDALPLEIVLEPEARKINLRLDFGGGRIIEDSIVLEKSTPEYNKLRAGSFHGFRAHRMVGSDPETYNIDVRQQPQQPALNFNQPAAPAASTSSPAKPVEVKPQQPARTNTIDLGGSNPAPTVNDRFQRPNGPVAPVMEKAPTAIWEEKSHKREAPHFENVAAGSDKPKANNVKKDIPVVETEKKKQGISTAEEVKKKIQQKMDIRLIIIGVATIAAALILWWIYLLVSGDTTKNSTPDQPVQQGESIEEVTYSDAAGQVTDAAAPAADQTAAQPVQAAVTAAANDQEKADVEYLNNNTTWRLADLKSDKYRALITDMQKGDIQAVASNPYFSIPGTATNKKAEAVIGYLWKAKDSQQEKRNVEKLRDLTKADKANLGELIDVLSRYQPAEGNKAPRPGAN
ncbi:MAG: hypothetical protein NC338_01495 [Firmicutes bacterium]|nr:hypothetical protein [Bacillota bacterium]MCM1401065.1 hypothetical protein [Bacteroides sp.]MCM1476984.1 hypothetical protein [Bacteroides sp.]